MDNQRMMLDRALDARRTTGVYSHNCDEVELSQGYALLAIAEELRELRLVFERIEKLLVEDGG